MTAKRLGDAPIICLVSDRRQLAPHEDWNHVVGVFAALAAKAGEAGIDLFQIREPGIEAARLVELTVAAVGAARGSPTRIIVNDRLDVALTAGADGVHLRSDSVTPRVAREMVPPGFLIGRSVHGAEEAVVHGAVVDYLIAGTVFQSASKPPEHPLVGVEGLKGIVRATKAPVLAIGGVTLDRVPGVAAAGAAGIAAIRLFTQAPSLTEIARAVRTAFDSVRSAS